MAVYRYRKTARMVAYIELVFNVPFLVLGIYAAFYYGTCASRYTTEMCTTDQKQDNLGLKLVLAIMGVALGHLKMWTISSLLKATAPGTDPDLARRRIGSWREVLIVFLIVEVTVGLVELAFWPVLIAVLFRGFLLYFVNTFLNELNRTNKFDEEALVSNEHSSIKPGDTDSKPNSISKGQGQLLPPFSYQVAARIAGCLDMALTLLTFVYGLVLYLTFAGISTNKNISYGKSANLNDIDMVDIFLTVGLGIFLGCTMLKLWSVSLLLESTFPAVNPADGLKKIRKWQIVLIFLAILQLPYGMIERFVLLDLLIRGILLYIIECYTDELYGELIQLK